MLYFWVNDFLTEGNSSLQRSIRCGANASNGMVEVLKNSICAAKKKKNEIVWAHNL